MTDKGDSNKSGVPTESKCDNNNSTLAKNCMTKQSSDINLKHLQGLLTFLDKENSNSDQQKLLLQEMIETDTNILKDIKIIEENGKQLIHIETTHDKIDLIPAGTEFGASIIKDTISGNIGLFLYYQKGTFNGNLIVNLEDLAIMFKEGSYFLYKKDGEVCIKDFGVEGKCLLNSKSGDVFQINGVKPEEIQLMEREIDKVGFETVDFVLNSCDNNMLLFADTMLLNKYISKEVADIIKKMHGNIDVL